MSLWTGKPVDLDPDIVLPSHDELVEALKKLPPFEMTDEEQKRYDAFDTPVTSEVLNYWVP